MAPPLLTLTDIRLTFGGTALFDGVDLTISAGDRIGLVGRNGSGKSTLLKIAAGRIEADGGTRFCQPGARVTYLAQEPDFGAFETVLDFAKSGLDDEHGAYRARLLLHELGLGGDESPAQISGGQARRAAIAAALAPEPDVILLDEPTNHLDLPAIEWLERELKQLGAAFVMISHDRAFLSALTNQTVWLDRGRSRELAQGFAAFEAWRDEIFEKEEAERHKLDRKIVREEKWLHGGVTARRKRNVRRVAELAELRKQRQETRGVTGNVRMEVSTGGVTGKLVIEAKSVCKAFGGHELLNDFSVRITRGDRVAIAGPNGSGKTTMLNVLTGELEPDSGSVRHGTNLEIATLEQSRLSLDPATSLADTLTGGRGDSVTVNGRARHVASYLKDFLFAPEQMRSPVGALSGGERARLMLARAFSRPSNVLVLDEPTNDLDLETLDLLQELVSDYPGTVLLVSHDRDFLDRTATSVIARDSSDRWREYAGGYSDMIAQRRDDTASRSVVPVSKVQRTGRDQPAKQNERPKAAERQGRKMSFKDKHALATLPDRIGELEDEIGKLSAQLNDPDLYNRDPDLFASTTSRLGELEEEKRAAEDRWLELEMLREELEG